MCKEFDKGERGGGEGGKERKKKTEAPLVVEEAIN